MARIRNMKTRLAVADTRRIRPSVKTVDPFYNSPEYRRWRHQVMVRAGWQCEGTEADGSRCTACAPDYRLYADHIIERRDGGADLDPANGQCLCARHHALKTVAERAKRAGLKPPDPKK